jgi:hypothetical protein
MKILLHDPSGYISVSSVLYCSYEQCIILRDYQYVIHMSRCAIISINIYNIVSFCITFCVLTGTEYMLIKCHGDLWTRISCYEIIGLVLCISCHEIIGLTYIYIIYIYRATCSQCLTIDVVNQYMCAHGARSVSVLVYRPTQRSYVSRLCDCCHNAPVHSSTVYEFVHCLTWHLAVFPTFCIYSLYINIVKFVNGK